MLNVKKTLTKLLGRVGVEEFNLSAYSGFDNAFGVGKYDKATNTVRLYVFGVDTANISSSTALFTVPSAYRPSTNTAMPIAYATSSASGVYYATLNASNGTITQGATNSLRQVIGFCEYTLGGVIRQLLSTLATAFVRKGVAVC